MATTQRILTAEEIAARGSDAPVYLRLPQVDSVFSLRADRLAALAPGHGMSDYLSFLRRIALEQQALLDAYPAMTTLPDEAALELARAHAMPPLAIRTWNRDPSWRAVARRLASNVAQDIDGQARQVALRVAGADDDWLEDEAGRILNHYECDRGTAVFVAAALQVYWTRLTTLLGVSVFGRLEASGVCPCCGSRPVASVMRPGAGGLHRYLVCSLCAAEWNVVRIKCVICDSTEGIAYYGIEGGGDAVRAETCDHCKSYVKMFHADKAPLLDPVADDLASIDLDFMLADTTAFERAGVNFALFPGEDDAGGVRG